MSDNMRLWEAVRKPPKEALRKIEAGRLKGKTDINPVFRLKTLTELFGPCGIGWKYTIKSERFEPGPDGEVAAFVDIDLYVKMGGEWSEAIPGTGGSMFVSKEKGGLYTDDEALKKALTDAISVSCKALGVAADIYWEKDPTKYTDPERATRKPTEPRPMPSEEYIQQFASKPEPICEECGEPIHPYKKRNGDIVFTDQIISETRQKYGKALCTKCFSKHIKEEKNA